MSANASNPLRDIVARIGGELYAGGTQALVPGPGHSKADRSLSLTLVNDRVIWNSFAGDNVDPIAVFRHLDIERDREDFPCDQRTRTAAPTDAERTAGALALWNQATDPAGTPVEAYLARRGLTLPPSAAGEVIRWHSHCPFGPGRRTGCMVALARHVLTDQPQAIHRTALTADGSKAEHEGMSRRSLGPLAGAAVKLSADGDVETCLGVAEGIETALSIRALSQFASVPVWSLLSARQLAALPVLPVLSGIGGLIIAVDNDPTGKEAARGLRHRWLAGGVDVQILMPKTPGADLNDVVRGLHE